MIGIPIGLLYANGIEWAAHKYLLHGLGKNKESYWSFHWHEHHNSTRKHGGYDVHYERSVMHKGAQRKEAVALALGVAAHIPLAPVAPFFFGTLCYSAVNYYVKHKKSHNDPEWARVNLPWHYDHHMGRNQDANWCVTKPWFDHIMGTRIPYVDTDREVKRRSRDIERYEKIIAPDKVLERMLEYTPNKLEKIVTGGVSVAKNHYNKPHTFKRIKRLKSIWDTLNS